MERMERLERLARLERAEHDLLVAGEQDEAKPARDVHAAKSQ